MTTGTAPRDIIDGDFKVKPEESMLAVVPPKEVALSSQDPVEFLDRAVKQANALKKVIDAKNLSVRIGGSAKPHVLIDGWQTLMALNGVMPYTVTCTKERDEEKRLTVHVVTEIRRVEDGTVLTRVAAECSQHESRWAKADDYAVISMAQTRGVGKGCRQLFGWVMALAGFSATPAEEMTAPAERPSEERRPDPAPTETKVEPMSSEAIALIQGTMKAIIEGAKKKDPLMVKAQKAWADFFDAGPLRWGDPKHPEQGGLFGDAKWTESAMKVLEIPWPPENIESALRPPK